MLFCAEYFALFAAPTRPEKILQKKKGKNLGKTPPPPSNPWGLKSPKSPPSNKTLSDIMKEEKTNAGNESNVSQSSGSRRYADLVSVSSPSFAAPKQSIEQGSLISNVSNASNNAGWSVVGKSGQIIPPER